MRADAELGRQAAKAVRQNLMDDVVHPPHFVIDSLFLRWKRLALRVDLLAEFQIAPLLRLLIDLCIAERHFRAGMVEEALHRGQRDIISDEAHGERMPEHMCVEMKWRAVGVLDLAGVDEGIHVLA